jgi:hypothetical protein
MIVHRGRKEQDGGDARLYRIKGSYEGDSCTMEIQKSSKLLNSSSSFYLWTKKTCYAWIGSGCSSFSASMATEVHNILGNGSKLIELKEGSESDEFWKLLGGKHAYYRPLHPQWNPRFFQFTNASGMLSADLLSQCSCDDLLPESIVMLDAFDKCDDK